VPRDADDDAGELFSHRWIHVFEEDSADGAVYRAEDTDVPLSRRPRERIELSSDGSARVFMPGPDDRLIEQAATWREVGDDIVIRAASRRGGDKEYRVVQRSPGRLVIRE
jgi:hypothetical protein